MAGLLMEAQVIATVRRWASSPCAPYPCGEDVWAYACAVQGIALTQLPDHTSRKAMSQLLKEKGGLVAYADALMTSIGWRRVVVPARGDVAVAGLGRLGLTCVICLDGAGNGLPLWVARGDQAVVTVRAPFKQAWRSPCQPQ